jgi:hypothetical protein
MTKVDIEKFNEEIANAFVGNDDDEIRNWAATQYGKLAAGIEVDVDDLPERCPLCGSAVDVAKRRRLSSYNDDKLNWMVSCRACFEEDTTQLEYAWDEYYSLIW